MDLLGLTLPSLLAAATEAPSPVASQAMRLVQGGTGGIFMIFIVISSLVATGVIIHRFLSLTWGLTLPKAMRGYIEQATQQPSLEAIRIIESEASEGRSPLSRIVNRAFQLRRESSENLRSGVEATAREEVMKLQFGMPTLEVVITIAPLLGLLGTVSALVTVFGLVGSTSAMDSPDPAKMAAGIAEALYTTIGGLVVAVPVVIAHSFFNKRIEVMAARMEVLVEQVLQLLQSPHANAPQPAPMVPPPPARPVRGPRSTIPVA